MECAVGAGFDVEVPFFECHLFEESIVEGHRSVDDAFYGREVLRALGD